MIRSFAMLALTLAPSVAAPPPAPLARYVRDDHFDPGDYLRMRGAFADATLAQKGEWRAIGDWQRRCQDDQRPAVVAAFAKRGVAVASSHPMMGDGLCGEVAYAKLAIKHNGSWADFTAARDRARPIAQAILWSAALAQSVADPDKPGEAADLVARPMTDQVLRSALNWDHGGIQGAPALDPAEEAIAQGMIWHAIAARDHANTAWLKALVAEHGWPTVAAVGEDASGDAWLLVQHADDNPVFQYDMLHLMEPLATRGAIARRNFAMLDNRVRLKLTNKQRYGTQFTCKGGHHVPLPLKDETKVDARRAAMELDTVAQNVARMDKAYGRCPPDPVPPAAKL